MICGFCKNNCFHVRISYNDDGVRRESCNNCGNSSVSFIPDVYWPGHSHTNPNITDHMGREIELTSRGQKAAIMRQQGISEAGDRYHGSVQGNYAYQLKGQANGKKR